MAQLMWTPEEVAAGKAPKARKQCPKCSNYYHAKRPACPICHPETVVVLEKWWDEPGRKRKQCSNCKKYIGHSQEVCPNCQAPQAAKTNSEPVDVPNPPIALDAVPETSDHTHTPSALAPRIYGADSKRWKIQMHNEQEASLSFQSCRCGMEISYAVGCMPGDKKPPAFPSNPTDENVLDWAGRVMNWGHEERNKHISPTALRVLAQHSLGASGEAYQRVYALLQNYGCRMSLHVEETEKTEMPNVTTTCEHEFLDDSENCMECGAFVGNS